MLGPERWLDLGDNKLNFICSLDICPVMKHHTGAISAEGDTTDSETELITTRMMRSNEREQPAGFYIFTFPLLNSAWWMLYYTVESTLRFSEDILCA